MRLAHLSDSHLGRASPGDPNGSERLNAFRQALAALAGHNPDALIIAGDTFDGPHVDSPVVEDAAKNLSRLKNGQGLAIPVVVIPGNHDPAEAEKLWSLFRKHIGPSVHLLLEPQAIAMADGKLVVEAYPCATRYSAEPPWEKRVPLPAAVGDQVHIVVAHGTLQGGPVPDNDTDAYPFSQTELEGLAANYVALGHFHGLYPPWGEGEGEECQRSYSYSGTHEPDQFGGTSGYALLVTVLPGQPARLRRIKLARRDWRLVPLTGPVDLDKVEHLQAEIEASDDRSRYVVRLKMSTRQAWSRAEVERLDRLEEAMRAVGAQVDRRGEPQVRLDTEALDFGALPSGAIREALLSLKSDAESAGDKHSQQVLAAALQVGWETVQEAMRT
jgi:DNA repair exonuclease SbcCD nuclease subunit